jgi:hypothetical protein
MSYPYIIQGGNLVIVIDNQPHTISKTHVSFERIKEAIKASEWDAVRDLVSPKKTILKYGAGNVAIQGEKMYWKNQEFHGSLAVRMISMFQEGFPIEPMVNFMENLMTNPSKSSVEQLYKFLEKNNLPMTEDGHFLAFKKVRADYKDIHSGTFDNSVGQICEMERNTVDDNRDVTCSSGLHFCSQEYLAHFGGSDSRTMIVKINPRDVVSIPSDYNDAKGRACRYEVIGELGVSIDAAFTASVQEGAHTVDTSVSATA